MKKFLIIFDFIVAAFFGPNFSAARNMFPSTMSFLFLAGNMLFSAIELLPLTRKQ